MKVIISHDVDHISVWEHTKDLILPKFIVRAKLELFSGKISLSEFFNRMGDFFQNQWHRVPEVIAANKAEGIKSAFFFGVNNGVGLNYPVEFAIPWINHAIEEGFEVGVHGIDFDSLEKVKKEYSTFKELSALNSFGIRMHYLRQNEHTFNYMEQSGYRFDASEQGYKNPYLIGKMWEFPLQIMDGWVVNGEKRYQFRNLEQCKDYTKEKIDKAINEELNVLSILFHDRYFSSSFKTWKNWYEWLLIYLKDQKFEFVTHDQAIVELEK